MDHAILGAPLPYIAIPALVAVTGGVFVYGGIVRLKDLNKAPAEQRAAGVIWGTIGVVVGIALIVGAIMLYAGA